MAKEFVVLAVLGAIIALLAAGMHQVPEGHICVYYSGGALLDHVSEPGWRFMVPFVTTRDFVQLTMQTDVSFFVLTQKTVRLKAFFSLFATFLAAPARE